MDNHPVPQNISSYEFHLVGDMTLKQFLQLAGGLVLAYIFWTLQIPGILKFPLAIISAIMGILMAFVPINGRPFSAWFTAFIKAIYSPTEFVWVPDEMIAAMTPPPASLPATPPPPAPTSPPPPPPPEKTASPAPTKPVPSFSDFLSTKKVPANETAHAKETTTIKISNVPKPPPTPASTPVSTPQPAQVPTLTPISDVSPDEISRNSNAGQNTPTAVYTSGSQIPTTSPVSSAPSASPTFQISPPTQPNILAGLIVDQNNSPLPQITVEVVDISTGIPSRALRSNKLGQFQIAIPLPAGNYNVIAEKDGMTFEPVSVQVKGSIVPPIIIKAK